MDIIRSHLPRFIELHNSHPIQLLRKHQDYLPTGQPFLLYYYSEGSKDYKKKVDDKILAALRKEVADYNLDEYLSASTITLYGEILEAGRYPQKFGYNHPHDQEAYLYLRDQVFPHSAFGGQVQLATHLVGVQNGF